MGFLQGALCVIAIVSLCCSIFKMGEYHGEMRTLLKFQLEEQDKQVQDTNN
jgi:hypothetical protein